MTPEKVEKLSKDLHLQEAKDLYEKLNSSEKVAKKLCNKYGINYTGTQSRKIRRWLNTKNVEGEDIHFKKAKGRQVLKSKYYIITSGQNATPVNKKVWKSILLYSEHLGAEIVVIPMRYKNPTSVWNKNNEKEEWWDSLLHPYMTANRQHIHKNLEIIGDVKISPTASTPLSGFEGLSGVESSFFGHPRQHFKTLPILDGMPHKFLATTGTVTERNYTDSKAGKKADFHHTFGFIVVENFEDDSFTFRHVSSTENGVFYDLDNYVSNKGVKKDKKSVSTVVLGDLHLGETCDKSLKASYKMLKRFKPKNVVCHDIMEGYSVNPHDDPFVIANKESEGKLSISFEIKNVLNFIDTILQYNPVIVKSNHDIFIDRYLLNDWRKNYSKAEYLKYAHLKTAGQITNGILPYEIKQRFGDKVLCLTENDSFKVNGVELGIHGHIGVSGTRGGITQYKRINTKMIIGHTHSPAKEDGCMYVGTLTKLRMGYNKGLSSWCNSNGIVHKNGKTQNILIFNGKYTTL